MYTTRFIYNSMFHCFMLETAKLICYGKVNSGLLSLFAHWQIIIIIIIIFIHYQWTKMLFKDE